MLMGLIICPNCEEKCFTWSYDDEAIPTTMKKALKFKL